MKIRFKEDTKEKMWQYPLLGAWGLDIILCVFFLLEWSGMQFRGMSFNLAESIGIEPYWLVLITGLIAVAYWIPEWLKDRKNDVRQWWNKHYTDGVLEL